MMTLLPELHAYRSGHDPIAGPAGPVRTVPAPAMSADPPPRLHALPGMPPAAHERGVSVHDAALALERIMARFDGGAPGPRVSLPDVERADMEALAMTATVLSLRSFGDTAKATLKALEIATQAEDSLRREQVLQYQQQMDHAVEQADKARKAGVLGVVFDWIIAVAEVVSGLFKMVTGTLTGNPLSVAGGAMDLMAGLAGLVKATANTLALVDPDNAEKHRAAADEAGKVQLSFEIAGAAVDVTSAARNLLVTRVMGKTAISVLENGAAPVLLAAIREGSEGAITGIARSVGRDVAEQVAVQIRQTVGKACRESAEGASRALGVPGFNRVAEAFTREAIEVLVARSVERVAARAMAKGGVISAEALATAVGRQVADDVVRAVLKASVTVLDVTRTVAQSTRQAAGGVLALQRAALQQDIEALILDQQWLQTCIQFHETTKRVANDSLGDLAGRQAAVLDGMHGMAGRAASLQVRIASGMV